MKALVVGGLLALSVGTVWAASPAVSRGEVLLQVSFEECMALAKSAFTAEGYKVAPSDQKSVSFVLAHKDIHTAYITCSPAPKFDMWANIFVASYTQDRNVPGNERVKLQTHLANAKAKKMP